MSVHDPTPFVRLSLAALAFLNLTTHAAADDCAILRDPGFPRLFHHMTETQERCPRAADCADERMIWSGPLRLGFANLPDTDALRDGIRRMLKPMLSDLAALTGRSIAFVEPEADPNVFVLLMNDTLLASLEGGAIPAIDLEEFAAYQAPIYRRGYCSATVGSFAGNDGQIDAAFAYVNVNLSGDRLRGCLLEEMVAIVGLSNDPPGQASLFDRGNHRRTPDGIALSRRTELVIESLYRIADEGLDGIDAVIAERCPEEP